MLTALGFVAVACIAIVAFVISTAATVGAFEILTISIFGFVAIVCMIAFTILAMAKYTGNKVKGKVKQVKSSFLKFKSFK